MPTYPTPSPIDLALAVQVGSIEVIATDRDDTVVTVSPTNPEKATDRRGAEDTSVAFDGGRLTVTAPKPRFSVIGPSESIDVRVELPTGSRLTAEIAVGGVRSLGRLGATRIKCSTGAVDVGDTGDLWVRASHGNATAATIDGSAEITADHGRIRIGTVAGDAILKSSHGAISIEESRGDVDARLSYGEFEIRSALGSVSAKLSYGGVSLGEVSSGSIQVESGFGEIAVGVREGVPAWLDLSSKQGRVRNEIEGSSAPDASEKSVAVRARTAFGDIHVRRAR
ncbi:MAG: hypothetical protein RI885_653 [Actinomycetota bacterium]|jgi:hypothetical protein